MSLCCGEKEGQGKYWEGKGRGAEVLKNSPDCVAQLAVALSHALKGCMFDSQSGTYLGCKFDPQLGCVREVIDRCFFPSLSLSFSFLFIKSMKAISLGEDFF